MQFLWQNLLKCEWSLHLDYADYDWWPISCTKQSLTLLNSLVTDWCFNWQESSMKSVPDVSPIETSLWRDVMHIRNRYMCTESDDGVYILSYSACQSVLCASGDPQYSDVTVMQLLTTAVLLLGLDQFIFLWSLNTSTLST